MTGDQAVAELRARCADLESAIRRGGEKLTEQLLSGQDTSALRDQLIRLAAKLDEGRREFREQHERLLSERDKALGIEANALACEAARRLKAMLRLLQPPPAPFGATVAPATPLGAAQ